MASNDGQRLLVLGLTFRQHHTLHMQQVLRAYERLPENPMDRGALYAGLFELAKEIDEDETRNLENWLKNGGEFPAPPRPAAEEAADPTGGDDEEEGEWPDYRPEDFVTDASENEADDFNMEDGVEEGSDDESDDELPVNIPDDATDDDFEDDEEMLDAPPRRSRNKGKASGVLIECLICAEEYDSSEFPETTKVTLNCHHKNDERVCVYCLQQTIATAVAEGQLHLIICPFCPEKLSHNEVQQHATREVFARYFYPCPKI